MLLEIQNDAGRVIRASRLSWAMMLWLARDAGWAGAERFIADGRALWPEAGGPGWRLEAAEAAALAAALEAALADIPDHDAVLHKVAWIIDLPEWSRPDRVDSAGLGGSGGSGGSGGLAGPGKPGGIEPERYRVRYLRPGQHVGPFEYFSGPNKHRLRRMIDLSRHGGLNMRARADSGTGAV